MHTEDLDNMHELQQINAALPEVYTGIMEQIESRLPEIRYESRIFNKSASQLKTVTLDIKDLTPISTAKHIMASIARTRAALEESYISVRRTRVDIEEALHLASITLDFDHERHLIDADEGQNKLDGLEEAMGGAVRKLSHLIAQYDAILEYLGVDVITEEMYEQDQARCHVMTAFAQGLSAARARGGVIDEGNMIYLFDLGINGAMAQAEIMDLLKQEDLLIQDGMAPTHDHTRQWLEQIGDKYQQFVVDGARNKGLIPYNEQALIFGQADE